MCKKWRPLDIFAAYSVSHLSHQRLCTCGCVRVCVCARARAYTCACESLHSCLVLSCLKYEKFQWKLPYMIQQHVLCILTSNLACLAILDRAYCHSITCHQEKIHCYIPFWKQRSIVQICAYLSAVIKSNGLSWFAACFRRMTKEAIGLDSIIVQCERAFFRDQPAGNPLADRDYI